MAYTELPLVSEGNVVASVNDTGSLRTLPPTTDDVAEPNAGASSPMNANTDTCTASPAERGMRSMVQATR